jgi:hypothetical protein
VHSNLFPIGGDWKLENVSSLPSRWHVRVGGDNIYVARMFDV